MSDDRAARSDLHWVFWLAAAPAVLVLYVLSIGPAAWIVAVPDWMDVALPIFQIGYAPLIWLHDHTFMRNPLEWYIGLWVWR